MKKFLLSLAGASMALSSVAATKILYQQDFENVTDPAAAGWTASGTVNTLASDTNGKYLRIKNAENGGRSASVNWGKDFYTNNGESVLEDGIYTMKFDFCFEAQCSQNVDNAITVFTEARNITNATYRNPWNVKAAPIWDSYIFDLTGAGAAKDKDRTIMVANGGPLAQGANYPGSTEGAYSYGTGKWYTATSVVDVNTRKVTYSIVKRDGGEVVASGVRNVPEANPDASAIDMFASGIHVAMAKGSTGVTLFDNISITCESASEVSNAPVITLARVGVDAEGVENLNLRAYDIIFLAGETLHIGDANGEKPAVDFDSCNGKYTYETTTSGVFQAWTTKGSATSPVVEEIADCTPCHLPDAVIGYSSIGLGYKKTYTFSADNSKVPLKPAITLSYSFAPITGATIAGEENSVAVDSKGTLTVTASALGYAPSTVVVENQNLDIKKSYDFARMTQEEIIAAGFPDNFQTLNSTGTSGFNCWTGRKNIYYVDAETGAKVYPFSSAPYMVYVVVDNSEEPAGLINDNYFEGLSIFPATGKGNKNVGFINHVGLFNDQTSDNYNDIVVNGLDETDFVAFNTINGYGSNSNHPTVASADEFYAQLAGQDNILTVAPGATSVAFPLFRIDTACTKITVYKQIGENEVPTAIETVKAEATGDNFYYTIDGKRLAQPTAPGFYIHNGKKLIIR